MQVHINVQTLVPSLSICPSKACLNELECQAPPPLIIFSKSFCISLTVLSCKVSHGLGIQFSSKHFSIESAQHFYVWLLFVLKTDEELFLFTVPILISKAQFYASALLVYYTYCSVLLNLTLPRIVILAPDTKLLWLC